jgi:hypothetical protein
LSVEDDFTMEDDITEVTAPFHANDSVLRLGPVGTSDSWWLWGGTSDLWWGNTGGKTAYENAGEHGSHDLTCILTALTALQREDSRYQELANKLKKKR